MASTVRMNQDGWTMIKDFRFFRNLRGETEEARWAPWESPGEGAVNRCYLLSVPRRRYAYLHWQGGGGISVKLSRLAEFAGGRADVWSPVSLNLESERLTSWPHRLPFLKDFSGVPWF